MSMDALILIRRELSSPARRSSSEMCSHSAMLARGSRKCSTAIGLTLTPESSSTVVRRQQQARRRTTAPLPKPDPVRVHCGTLAQVSDLAPGGCATVARVAPVTDIYAKLRTPQPTPEGELCSCSGTPPVKLMTMRQVAGF